MDSLIKSEQIFTSQNLLEADHDFLNSLLPLDEDNSFCDSIDNYTHGLFLPVLSPTSSSSTSSSTASFFNITESTEMNFNNPTNQPSLSPAPSATSTNSSLSLSIDMNAANFLLLNPQSKTSLGSDSYDSFCLTSNFNDQFIGQSSQFSNWTSGVKQDVSVGTDLTIGREVRCKKDFDWSNGLKFNLIDSSRIPNFGISNQIAKNDKESFKLVEKIQPKKSRTKYTKEQIDVLESTYWRNAYPDVITIEHLSKSLGISREKINIWFQNRRARSKRHGI
ncbi:rhox homeobox family member 1 [Brachionus plicatilis]|uniref:Rhox homeobox family member 1 n=1 Tax=Brachionus plicatilis TaxID=10195 RepID=A0A3M7SK90_BRAPC|nr:rhox homeobox family member 1 [Brachionus plicatilis]